MIDLSVISPGTKPGGRGAVGASSAAAADPGPKSQTSGVGRLAPLRLRGISMRWWLAAAFAAIAIVTALATAGLYSQRSEQALRQRAEDLVAARAFAAAVDIGRAVSAGQLANRLPAIARGHSLSLYVYDAQGRLVTSRGSERTILDALPFRTEALTAALEGRRFLRSTGHGREMVVAIPFSGRGVGAILAVSERQDLPTSLGILRRKVFEAAGFAVLIGALAGVLVAFLIVRRLRRIATAAKRIEGGDFAGTLTPGFPDELGDLAGSIDRMRTHLATSFATLANERDRLEQILGQLNEGVVAVRPDLTVAFANSRTTRMLDAPVEVGAPVPEPWPEFSLRAFAASLFDGDLRSERTHLATSGEETYGVVGIPAGDGDTAVLVLSDVTAEERRERAEREFVTNAAHELRTPLQTILGAVEMLQAGAKEDTAERDMFLGHIERETARLTRLVRALLVLARAQTLDETLSLSAVELRPLVEVVAAAVRPRAGVRLEIECPGGLAASTHHDLLEEALGNLAANAAKHTRDGRILLRGRAVDGTAVIEVSDTGPGIDAAHRRRVGDRFYRGENRSADGFGLGLAIALQCVRAVGGTLTIDSQPGRGTTAGVVLPLAEEATT